MHSWKYKHWHLFIAFRMDTGQFLLEKLKSNQRLQNMHTYSPFLQIRFYFSLPFIRHMVIHSMIFICQMPVRIFKSQQGVVEDWASSLLQTDWTFPDQLVSWAVFLLHFLKSWLWFQGFFEGDLFVWVLLFEIFCWFIFGGGVQGWCSQQNIDR